MTYTEPLLLCVIGLLAAGMVLTPGRTVLLRWALAGLFAVSWPPVDWILSRPLEVWYPVRPFPETDRPQAIVALASSIEVPNFARTFPLLGADTYERCGFAAWLYANHHLPILVSGGPIKGSSLTYAGVMRDHLVRSGIPAAMVWTEEHSTNTHENAAFSAAILRSRGISGIALVVDATSMPRAERCFRKEGFQVVPAPSGFRVWGSLERELLPNWRSVRRNEIMLHETLGFLWYRLRGWI